MERIRDASVTAMSPDRGHWGNQLEGKRVGAQEAQDLESRKAGTPFGGVSPPFLWFIVG